MAMLPVEGGSNSSDQSVPGGNETQARERLLPRNYEDILKFAVENTNPEEASHEPMSEEVIIRTQVFLFNTFVALRYTTLMLILY